MNTNHSKAKPADDPYAKAHQKMVDRLRHKGISDARVLEAMARIPRHLFVEEALQDRAYGDHPLPIGCGQTISQPFMVALMSQVLKIETHFRILEIGAGSGYQTAILAFLARRVYAIERIPRLAEMAQRRLKLLRLNNAIVRASDGTLGWSEHALYDAILVAAGSPEIPQPLVDQLAIGGRLAIPVGDEKEQRLYLIIKGESENRIEDHGGCVFVKLLGTHGWQE
jgi:protein-L-isoaspartate(D-aspartate) O-methyltransferase